MTGLIRTMALTAASVIAIGVAGTTSASAQEVNVDCRSDPTEDRTECGDGANTNGDDTTAYGADAQATDVEDEQASAWSRARFRAMPRRRRSGSTFGRPAPARSSMRSSAGAPPKSACRAATLARRSGTCASAGSA